MNDVFTFGRQRFGFFARLPWNAPAVRKTVIRLSLAVLTVAAFSLLLEMRMAIAFCVSIAWHEYGHLLQAKREGMKTDGFILIPFIGGVAFAHGRFSSAAEVRIALAGPFFGFLLMSAAMGAFVLTEDPFFGKVALLNAVLNLFNLLPFYPLDGGRVFHALSIGISDFLGRQYLACSMVLALTSALQLKAPLLLLLFIFAFSRYRAIKEEENLLKETSDLLEEKRVELRRLLQEHLPRAQSTGDSLLSALLLRMQRRIDPEIENDQIGALSMTPNTNTAPSLTSSDDATTAVAAVNAPRLVDFADVIICNSALESVERDFRETVRLYREEKRMRLPEVCFGLLAFVSIFTAFGCVSYILAQERLFYFL